jgi:hypothetical protein
MYLFIFIFSLTIHRLNDLLFTTLLLFRYRIRSELGQILMSQLKARLGIYRNRLEIGPDSAQPQIERSQRRSYDFLVGRALFLLQLRVIIQQTQRFSIRACSHRYAVTQIQIVFALDDGGEAGNRAFQPIDFSLRIGCLTADRNADRENNGSSRSPFYRGHPLTSRMAPGWQRPFIERVHAAAPRLHLRGARRAGRKMRVQFVSPLGRAFAVKE